MKQAEVTGVPTNPSHPDQPQVDDFVSTEELIRRQGVKSIGSVTELAADEDPFESEEEFADFLTDLYASRRADIA